MEGARQKGAPPLGAYTSEGRGGGEGQVGGGGGQRQAGAKGVSTAGTHASSSTRGAGGGKLNEYLEGKVGQQVHYPSVLRPETLPKRAANQKAAGNHGARAGAGNNHEVVQT